MGCSSSSSQHHCYRHCRLETETNGSTSSHSLLHELPKDQQFGDLTERAIAVSPDGRQFVYGTSAGLYLRSMDDIDAKLLSGTAGTLQRPFFSPDGKWIGFFSSTDRKLKKIAISGGAPVTLADVTANGSFSWNADDTIVYGQWGRGIMRVSANGGTPEQIIKPAENESIIHPQILPDGKSILFTHVSPTPFKIMVQSLKTGERKNCSKVALQNTSRLDISSMNLEAPFSPFGLISMLLK